MEDHEAQMSLKEVVAQCRDCKLIATSATLNAHKLSNVFGPLGDILILMTGQYEIEASCYAVAESRTKQ
ncbi:hypothetical protein KIW84_025019 [Lathyrus oleraceus]|uniref:Uncharacterized protein n=1 Tax=Pisum sativum TaxID=3888 RepID=A0A9D5BCT3_PEA|nr:hypothetical protein KIW84_025019 [Pisum sativum]